MPVYTLTLPASGLLVQYRSDDDMMRVVTADDANDDLDWGPTADMYSTERESFPHELKQECWPGDSANATWWLVIAAAAQPWHISARLKDGPVIPVHRLGPVVIVEWTSHPAVLEITVDGHTQSLVPFRSLSAGPAAHPYSEVRTGSGGWVGFTPLE